MANKELEAIERLAKRCARHAGNGSCEWDDYVESAGDCLRLVAEVRRLRVALEDIADMCDVPYAEPGDMAGVRDAALEALDAD